MQNKALYAFESSSLGKGIQIAQEVLEKLKLQLHGAHPLGRGGFLFIAFEGATPSSGEEFLTLVRGEKGIVLASPHPHLVNGLLHLQPDPSPEATGLVVFESDSPTSLLSSLNDHLKLESLQLFQLNLGLKNQPFAVVACLSEPNLKTVSCPVDVTRTYIGKLSPDWRKQYFI
jgi:hypothetical protein